MTIKTEGVYAGEFCISEGPRTYSRGKQTVDQNQVLLAGTVLGRKTRGAPTVTAVKAAGSGTGVLGAWTNDAGAQAGVYRLVCVAAASNAGLFNVYKPDGSFDGQATVAVAYNGSINGTIADGGTDWAVGDVITVTVVFAAGTDLVVALNPAATDGSQTAMGISWDAVTTGAGENVAAATVERLAEVDGNLLDWGTLTDDQITAGIAQLAALNPPIIVHT